MDRQAFATYPDLKDKVALIFGIGQSGDAESQYWGNGSAIAKVLSASGVKIFGCDINLDAALRTASRIRDSGGVCDVSQANVTKSGDVDSVVAAVMEKHGRIDILVNNVGNTKLGTAASMSEETWDAQVALNLKSVFLSCHAVLPIMEKQGSGSIINNASITGMRYIGKPQIAYASAKAAVIQFSKVTAVMYAPKGVRVNSVAPGLMFTPLLEMFGKSSSEDDRKTFEKVTRHNVPLGYMGNAFDVANGVAFLASHSSRYVTGQNLVMDGGLTSSTGTGAETTTDPVVRAKL